MNRKTIASESPTLFLLAVISVGVLAVLLGVSFAHAADITAVQSGNWNAPNSWAGGVIPGGLDYARLGAAGTVYVTTTQVQSAGLLVISNGASLTLGAEFPDCRGIEIQGAGTLNANGRSVVADNISLNTANTQIINRGSLVVANQFDIYSQPFTVTAADRINRYNPYDNVTTTVPGASLGRVTLYDDAVIRVQTGGGIGFTLADPRPLSFYPTPDQDHPSFMELPIDGLIPGWAFRWANPVGGDHVADIEKTVHEGGIRFAFTNGGGYAITSDGGYTYVVSQPVPEPVGLIVAALSGLGAVWWVRRTWPAGDANGPRGKLPNPN